MKPVFACLAFFSLFIISCNNQGSKTANDSSTDSLAATSLKIKKAGDSSFTAVFKIQERIKHELDSLGILLKNITAIKSLSPDQFKDLQSGVGKRMSNLEKISNLQPLEVGLNTAYNELNNSKLDISTRQEKLKEFLSFSKSIDDSIKSTLNKIENNQ